MIDELNLDVPDEEQVDSSTIAQALADLSQASSIPDSFADVPRGTMSGFSADEIDFGSNDWLERLCRLQIWLGLDSPLSLDAGAEDLATSLFRQITWRDHSDCFTVVASGSISLTPTGNQALEERLGRAVELKSDFEEKLEEEGAKAASETWRESWEEAGSEARKPFGEINAKVETWKIKSFKSNAEDKLLDLNPSYQRDVVWNVAESQKLIESILRGIPLPSVILTRSETSKMWQIVDGKQRLTALLRFIGQHPEARRHAKEMAGGLELFDRDFRSFYRKNNLSGKTSAQMFMPFKLGSFDDENDALYTLKGKYYSQIKDSQLKVGKDSIRILDIFETEVSEYLIPVIQYKNTQLQDIHRVFSLYNKQGRKLNAEELRNAAYHHLDLAKLMLVMSGDRGDKESLKELVGYIPAEISDQFSETGKILEGFGFGTARFKRTKVLSWATALMLQPASGDDGKVTIRSTAKQIDELLEGIDEDHPLHKPSTLIALARTWLDALTAHADADAAWSTTFRRRRGGTKWEELPLVASLIATCLLVEAGETEKLQTQLEAVRGVCTEIKLPRKTQNKSQWEFIAKFVVRFLEALAVDSADVGHSLEVRYGYNCLPTFQLLASSYKPD